MGHTVNPSISRSGGFRFIVDRARGRENVLEALTTRAQLVAKEGDRIIERMPCLDKQFILEQAFPRITRVIYFALVDENWPM